MDKYRILFVEEDYEFDGRGWLLIFPDNERLGLLQGFKTWEDAVEYMLLDIYLTTWAEHTTAEAVGRAKSMQSTWEACVKKMAERPPFDQDKPDG